MVYNLLMIHSVIRLGAFFVLNALDLEIIIEDRKAKQFISDIKYSPNNQFLAIASRDGRVYLHDSKTFSLLKTLVPLVRRCISSLIDFSVDGNVIRHATATDELFYFDSSSGDLISSTSSTRDLEWATNSCTQTWFSQGNPF
jgi:WD40 repeat protein